MGTIRIFSIWWFLFIFFIKWQRWCKVLCLINCNHEKRFFRFFWWKDLTILLDKQISKVDNTSTNLKELIENASEGKEIVLDELSKSYKDLTRDKELYTFNIKKEVESRELQKLETFKVSCLNIKLPKFLKVMIQQSTSLHFGQHLKNSVKYELQEQCYLIY